jgi:hypothetical protein
MTARGLALLFVGCVALFIVAGTPFLAVITALGLERAGISYSRAEGTLWSGRLTNVYWRDTAVGEMALRPLPFAILLGRLSIDVVLEGGAVQGRARISRGVFAPLALRDVTISADLSTLPVMMKLAGRIEASLAELVLGPRGCMRAQGRLTTDALTHGVADAPWRGPGLSGEVGCKGGALIVPLSGSDGTQTVDVLMTLHPDRSFDVRVELDTADPAMTQLLPALGFRRDGGMLVLEQEGRWG